MTEAGGPLYLGAAREKHEVHVLWCNTCLLPCPGLGVASGKAVWMCELQRRVLSVRPLFVRCLELLKPVLIPTMIGFPPLYGVRFVKEDIHVFQRRLRNNTD